MEAHEVKRFRFFEETENLFNNVLQTVTNVKSENVCSELCLQRNDSNAWLLDLTSDPSLCKCVKMQSKKPCLRGFFGHEISFWTNVSNSVSIKTTMVDDIDETCLGKAKCQIN